MSLSLSVRFVATDIDGRVETMSFATEEHCHHHRQTHTLHSRYVVTHFLWILDSDDVGDSGVVL